MAQVPPGSDGAGDLIPSDLIPPSATRTNVELPVGKRLHDDRFQLDRRPGKVDPETEFLTFGEGDKPVELSVGDMDHAEGVLTRRNIPNGEESG
jgi:hypothetical protein